MTVPFNKERDINVKKKFKTTNQNTHKQHFIGVEPHDTTTHLLPAHSYQFKKKQVNTKFAKRTQSQQKLLLMNKTQNGDILLPN